MLGSNISFWSRSKDVAANGVSHGGVAIAARTSISSMQPYELGNVDNYEIVAVLGYVQNIARKFFIIACYLPPNYTVPRAKSCLTFIYQTVLDIKNKFADPYIIVAGDFNQWDIATGLADFPDLWETIAGPTRGDRRIDRILSNLPEPNMLANIIPPLETEFSVSDHSIVVLTTEVEPRERSNWTVHEYRKTSKEADAMFVKKLSEQDWSDVLQARGTDNKAAAYQTIIDNLMDEFFPLKKSRRREGDLPWLDDRAKKKIKKKKAIYRDEGKSDRWIKAQDNLDRYLALRQENFLENQRGKFFSPNASKNFHKNVKNFKTAEKPKQFNVADIHPDKTEQEVAEMAATFFNEISKEFQPLSEEDIPTSHERIIDPLTVEQVADRRRAQKKPGSMVEGDMFPKLLNSVANYIAVPITSIFNELLETDVWPACWKVEYVTLIPKKSLPSAFSELRNISCTAFVSKVFESFLLQWAQEEVKVKHNQYGGVKGCSTSHMLVEMWQQICENAEDYRSATTLVAVDYAKAFNRLSYQKCLQAFKKKGASSKILALLATFLTDRVMKVRVGSRWSTQRSVDGGCPQGSILGVFLFNVTTDNL